MFQYLLAVRNSLLGLVLISFLLIPNAESYNKEPLSIPWASSVSALRYLAKLEADVYGDHLEIPDSEAKRTWLKEYRECSEIQNFGLSLEELGLTAAEFVAAHPILAFKMVRRFALGSFFHLAQGFASVSGISLDRSGRFIVHSYNYTRIGTEVASGIQNGLQDLILPGRNDLDEMMLNILRLITFYGRPLLNFVDDGETLKAVEVKLSVEELYELGSFALKEEIYTAALELLLDARQNVGINHALTIQIRNRIHELIFKHNRVLDMLNPRNSQDPKYIYRFESHLPKVIEDSAPPKTYRDVYNEKYTKHGVIGPSEQLNFIALCNGIPLSDTKSRSKLHCYLERGHSSYLILNPLKMEVYSQQTPYVYVIHDFIRRKEREKFLAEMSPSRLERGEVITIWDESVVLSPARTSSAFYFEEESELTRAMDVRVQTGTGLTLQNGIGYDGGEMLQLSSYANGNHFDPHADYHNSEEQMTTDGLRIAAVSVILKSTRVGFTVFPEAGIFVPPEEGSAIVWYNLKRNLEIDLSSKHAGCPVHGEKTILIQTINSYANFRHRKCTLHPFE